MTRRTAKKTAKSSVKSYARKVKEMEISAKSPSSRVEHKIGGTAVKVHKSSLIIAAIIVLLGMLLYFGRGFVVAAVINGQPISRIAVLAETEKQSGRQVLTTLIRNALIEQEAKKQNVVPLEKEIDDQIRKIEKNLSKQGQKIDQVLALEGMTREDLRRIIRLDLLVSKMVGKDIKIIDKDITDYIEKNKDILPRDQSESQLRQTVRERLKQQQISQKAQEWLADLEKKAKIVKFVNY